MHHDIQLFAEYAVTPFVGVWIETFGQCQKNTLGRVTPFVGVWIETEFKTSYDRYNGSHPSWVCGLKRETNQANRDIAERHTLRGCVD